MAAGGRAKTPDTPNDELAQLERRLNLDRLSRPDVGPFGYGNNHGYDAFVALAPKKLLAQASPGAASGFLIAGARVFDGSRHLGPQDADGAQQPRAVQQVGDFLERQLGTISRKVAARIEGPLNDAFRGLADRHGAADAPCRNGGAPAQEPPGARRGRRSARRGSAVRNVAAEAYRGALEGGEDPVLAVMRATGHGRRKSLRLIAGAREAGLLVSRHHRR